MKKIYLAMLVLLVLASCKKNDLPVDNGCISRVNRQNFGVNTADSAEAYNLMKQNKLPTNDIVLEYVHNDTITYAGPPYVVQNVFGIQYINGLPVLSDDFGYTFKNGVYQETTGTKYGTVRLDTRPVQSLPRLRELYITQINANMGTTTAPTFKDSCLVAELGYYNLNAGTNNTTPNIIKAWMITPKNRPYPQAIFRDDNGGKIRFVSGIIEF